MTTPDILSLVAELAKKKREIEVDKITTDHGKLVEKKKIQNELSSLTLNNIEKDRDVLKIIAELERDNILIKQSIPFISPRLGEVVPLVAGSVTLMGAISGTGKSSNSAAIAHRNFTLKKKTLIISNEEPAKQILARIACIDGGVNYNSYNGGLCSKEERKIVAKKIVEVSPFVTIVADHMISTVAEKIMKMLEEANETDEYTVAVIDFFQRITSSSILPKDTMPYEVLIKFKNLITDYASSAKLPVILMSQLMPMDPEEQNRNVESRIKGCKAIYEAASTVIEAIKLEDLPITQYHVYKSRFGGLKRHWVPHEYINGLFMPISKSRMEFLKDKLKMEKREAKLEELTAKYEDQDNGHS